MLLLVEFLPTPVVSSGGNTQQFYNKKINEWLEFLHGNLWSYDRRGSHPGA